MSSSFVSRFEAVSSRLRRVHLGQRLGLAVLLAAVGLGALAAADFAWELPWSMRAFGLSVVGTAAAVLAIAGLVIVFRRWTRPQTAVAIEHTFPELGQRVRTVVQYSGRDAAMKADGVAPSLAVALEDETATKAQPLPLDLVVPMRRLLVVAGTAAAVLIGLGLLGVSNPEWRTALKRALLSKEPWTTLAVAPGNAVVKEGESLTVKLNLAGRTNYPVTLAWRPAGDAKANWTEQTFEPAEKPERLVSFSHSLEKIRKPLEYRVIAGGLKSETYQIGVRHPLKLTAVKVELTPPAYTGLKASTQKDGNINGLAGTKARLQFDLDRQAARAKLVLKSQAEAPKGEEPLAPVEIPLVIEGKSLKAELELTEDQTYVIVANSADGMELADNKHRIRVRPDQPPTVWFEDPQEALEVHSLVEVLMKIRARDDFGLSKAGIVFQVNNEDEITLLLEEFADLIKEGKQPQTQALLEKLLPLEHFALTQKDSVTYYAFAEDNLPAGGRRTETDLRFVDIRPFRRTYLLLDPADPMMNSDNNKPLASLEELIARQRYALNQTIRMDKKAQKGQTDAAALQKLVEFEGKLATATHDVAARLEAFMLDGADLLFQAEKSMLSAVDSLQVAKFETATLQERDALRYLIEGRDKVQLALSKKPQAIRDQVRQFDRTQAQKLRKPKDEAETAAEVVEQLKQLAMQEEFVYESLNGLKVEGDNPPPSSTPGQSGSGKPDPKKPPMEKKPGEEGKPEEKPGEKPTENPGENTTGEKPGEKPGAAPKGEQPGENGTEENPGEKGGQKPGDKPEGTGEGEGEEGQGGKKGPTREELEQKQRDIVLTAYEIQKAIEKLQGISDLARQRLTEATKGAENVEGALTRGQTEEAAKEAGKTAGMLKELARNVEGLVAEETSRQVAMARDISDELSELERDLAKELERLQNAGGNSPMDQAGKPQPGAGQKPGEQKSPMGSGESQEPGEKGTGGRGEPKEPMEKGQGGSGPSKDPNGKGQGMGDKPLEDKAAELAEAGKTLQDILKAIEKSDAPADQEAARQIGQLMQEGKLQETIERMQGMIDQVREKQEDAGLAAEMVADNLESAARQLDSLHRQIVAPRVADLMKLEQQATEIAEMLDNLETERKITEWHQITDELLADLEKAGLTAQEIEDLREAMQGGGWGPDAKRRTAGWGWEFDRTRYGAPAVYTKATRKLVEKLQSHIQELVLRDMVAAGDEAAPPQYERQIEKYYEVLSADKK